MDWLKVFVWYPALMLFFFISGFLFFREHTFSRELYIQKLKHRASSLLVPYLLWNGMALLSIAIIQTLRPGFSLFLNKQIADFRWFDFLLVFWDKQAVTSQADDPHGPLLLQFWFIQSLIVVALFTPILWHGIKRLSWLFPVILGILLFISLPAVAGFKAEAFFYFTLGACFQLSGLWQKTVERPVLWSAVAIVMMLISISVPVFQVFYNMAFFLTVFGAAHIVACNSGRIANTFSRLSGASFFIFALHIFFSGAFPHLISLLNISWNSGLALITYAIVVTLNVCCCLILQQTVKRLTPTLYALMSGNR